MTDPNSNDPQVPQPPSEPAPQQPTPQEPAPPQPPAPEPESARTEPYDAQSEGGTTVDTEAREVPRQETPSQDSSGAKEPPQPDAEQPPEKAPGDHPWAMACHLSALVNLCCPVLGLVATMVIWQMNRSEDPEVDWHGKESLNFQLNLIPITLLLGVCILLKDWCFLFGPAILLLPLVYLGAMIYVLVASIRAAEGVRHRYPHIKRLLD